MDVFGYGTDEPTRPLLPPGLCWICENSPQQEAMKVIDTRRNSRPENRGQSERKYVCEPCAKELGQAVGQVSAEEHLRLTSEHAQLSNDLESALDRLRVAELGQPVVVDIDQVIEALRVKAADPVTAALIDVPPAPEE